MRWYYILIPKYIKEIGQRTYVFGSYKTREIAEQKLTELGPVGSVISLPTRNLAEVVKKLELSKITEAELQKMIEDTLGNKE